jgi:hypothetical protein
MIGASDKMKMVTITAVNDAGETSTAINAAVYGIGAVADCFVRNTGNATAFQVAISGTTITITHTAGHDFVVTILGV